MAAPDPAWPALKQHIEDHPVEGSPTAMRSAFAALAPPPVASLRYGTIGGVRCGMFGEGGRPIVWVHGGGLVFGSAATHSAMANAVAQATGRRVILPDYRLAPEHVWPAQREDLGALLTALDTPCDAIGDSAGGLVALIAALDQPKRVRRLALVSPNTDRRGRSTTRADNSPDDAMNDDADDERLAHMAFGDAPETIVEASPIDCDLSGLPPVWITASTQEVLLDDSLLLIRALGRAGVPTTAEIVAAPCHLWPLWPDRLDQAKRTIASIATFVGRA